LPGSFEALIVTQVFSLTLCTALCLCLAAPARADDAAAQAADWEARLKVAQEKQRRGSKLTAAAAKQFAAEQQACYKVFQVTSCQQESRLRYNQATKAAAVIKNEGEAEERLVKKEQRDDKDARYAADAPKREADLRAREARIASERAAAAAERDKRLADKAVQAEAGSQRRARAAERQQQKQLEHEQKVQKRLERAAREEAKASEAASQ